MPCRLRSATSTTARIGSIDTICAISLPWNENAACPISTGTSLTTPDHGARMTLRSRSASAAASAASAALNWVSRLTASSFGSEPCSTSFMRAASSVLRCISIAFACSTRASRASSERTAITSPCFTCCPRRTFSSLMTPSPRAVTIIFFSASVRPERTSCRLRGSSRATMTDTRNRFASATAGPTAARLSAVSCGNRCPDAIQAPAATTMPTATMRLPFMTCPRSCCRCPMPG